MLINTRGIVLKSTKYSETSLISTVYTEKKGLRQYILNGVRSKNAKTKVGLLRPMNMLHLVVYDREDKTINRIKELRSALIYQSIPFDVVKGAVGLFMIEIAEKSIKEAEENQPLFNFLFQAFHFLDQTTSSTKNLPISYLLELSRYLGIYPGRSWKEKFYGRIDDRILDDLLLCEISDCHQMKLSKSERQIVLNQLIEFYRQHLEGMQVIYSHEILKEVFE